MAGILIRLYKRTIELHNNIYATYKEIDKDIDFIKINCENINNNITMLESIINSIHICIKNAHTITNDTLAVIKEINNRVANNHDEIKNKIYLNYEHISDICSQLDKLSAQINKCNTKLITAKNSNRPRKVAKSVAHPKHND